MKIAFTSCFNFNQDKVQSTWNQISNYDPDYLFLLGDTIYMDYGITTIWQRLYSVKKFEKIMDRKYRKQFGCEAFQQLIKDMREKRNNFV